MADAPIGRTKFLTSCTPDLADAVLKWHTWLRVEKNVSPHTFRAYNSDVGEFISFLATHNAAEASLAQIADTKLTDFRSWLSRKAMDGLASSSRARSLSGVKNFLTWLDKSGILHNAAIKLVRTPKLPHKLPKSLEEVQAFRLLETNTDSEQDWVMLRNLALFTLLYGCGLRIQEALGLNISNLPAMDF